MSKKRMLADVLREAADVWLWDGRGDNPDFKDRSARCSESCCAVVSAEVGCRLSEERPYSTVRDESKALSFLRSLGCNPDDPAFYGYYYGRERQGVRYLWLLLAAQVAEDEGIDLP